MYVLMILCRPLTSPSLTVEPEKKRKKQNIHTKKAERKKKLNIVCAPVVNEVLLYISQQIHLITHVGGKDITEKEGNKRVTLKGNK